MFRLYVSGGRGYGDGLLAWASVPPAVSKESGGGEESVSPCLHEASSCQGDFSLFLKPPVEEAVLLCVAVNEVASMPLSVEAPWRKLLSSSSPRTPDREPTSYHFSSLCAELEALLDSVLLLDWLDEYGPSCSKRAFISFGDFNVMIK